MSNQVSDSNPSSVEVSDFKHRSRNRKYMIFTVGQERFATPLSEVKEVIALTTITPLPNVPRYFRGLINLRGKIISIMDLREKLGISSTQECTRPSIIIVEIGGVTVGMIVNDVLEVAGVEESQIERKLDIANATTRGQILGAVRFENKPLTLILDTSKAVDIAELASLRQELNQAKAS
ncbi:MAG: chemotaxis protein CheW [Bdellovibrionaceae bacterium]|nr:chemotaxis protein CheW [Pseudobdellovibrionaceae bacterium]